MGGTVVHWCIKRKAQLKVKQFIIMIKQVGLNGFNGFTYYTTFEVQLVINNFSQILCFRYLFNELTVDFYVKEFCCLIEKRQSLSF